MLFVDHTHATREEKKICSIKLKKKFITFHFTFTINFLFFGFNCVYFCEMTGFSVIFSRMKKQCVHKSLEKSFNLDFPLFCAYHFWPHDLLFTSYTSLVQTWFTHRSLLFVRDAVPRRRTKWSKFYFSFLTSIMAPPQPPQVSLSPAHKIKISNKSRVKLPPVKI